MLIAHRGYYNKYIPENSMLAFRKCVEKDIAIELDVHLTKDNKIVVFHDYNLKRMTGLNKKIEEVTYDEIKNLYLKNTKENIPLLKDVLKMVNNRVFLLIELKNKKIGPLEKELVNITKKYNNYCFQTFKLKSIYYLKKLTDTKVGLLIMNKIPKFILNNKKIDFISQNLFIFEKLKVDKEVYIFNVNNIKELALAKSYGQNYIVNIYNILKEL